MVPNEASRSERISDFCRKSSSFSMWLKAAMMEMISRSLEGADRLSRRLAEIAAMLVSISFNGRTTRCESTRPITTIRKAIVRMTPSSSVRNEARVV